MPSARPSFVLASFVVVAGLLLIGTRASAQVEYEGHLYDAIFTDLNWGDSSLDALDRSEPGTFCHLVTINSQGEQDFLFQNFEFGLFWIGLFQEPDAPEPDSGWGWVTREPLEYTNWEDGEPNDADGEDCAEISQAGWNDLNCFDDRPYLLECEPAVPTAPSGALRALALLLMLSGFFVVRRLRA